jgi:hypothetical protein
LQEGGTISKTLDLLPADAPAPPGSGRGFFYPYLLSVNDAGGLSNKNMAGLPGMGWRAKKPLGKEDPAATDNLYLVFKLIQYSYLYAIKKSAGRSEYFSKALRYSCLACN